MVELPKLYYFADPMCSWCYGFAPVMDQILKEHALSFDVRLVMGGLRPGKHAELMTPAVGRVIRHHWREVGKMTGQKFDEKFFERADFNYDTEPAAKAVIVMEQLAAAEAYTYYHKIQSAFYAQNRDITAVDVLAEIAENFGVERAAFLQSFASDATHKETWGQFTFSASLGIRGFPALVVEQGGQFMLLTRGYQPIEKMRQIFEQFGPAASGASCEVGEGC